jgi:hypothetical protein
MLSAQMIAKAWMDDAYHAELIGRGLKVPPKPDDLGEDQLDLLTMDREIGKANPDTTFC